MDKFMEALKKAYDEGWINDIDDPWADLTCYSTYDNYNNCCEDCPLEEFCMEAQDERLSGVIIPD